jgi:hypothetical protein
MSALRGKADMSEPIRDSRILLFVLTNVFYLRKMKFVASEVSNEDESEIKNKIKRVVEAVAADATQIFSTIGKALPQGFDVANKIHN